MLLFLTGVQYIYTLGERSRYYKTFSLQPSYAVITVILVHVSFSALNGDAYYNMVQCKQVSGHTDTYTHFFFN